MKTFDSKGNLIIEPDLEKGYLTVKEKPIYHKWIIDKHEESHTETIREYPNGGKDVKIVIDVEESGHWETKDANGNEVEHFEGFIPDDLPHDAEVEDIYQYQLYTPYTKKELKAIAQAKAEAEAEAQKAEEREAFLDDAMSQLDESETAIAELGEITTRNESALSALEETSANNESAIAELGEMAANNEVTINDLMEAIAELAEAIEASKEV